mmetsp:Transcript_81417/g.181846  ORF Transcript_81417/g.181846 Transcript_81417/m.181846 type:complete len:227 (+) Transcript_81417:83-763(+)
MSRCPLARSPAQAHQARVAPLCCCSSASNRRNLAGTSAAPAALARKDSLRRRTSCNSLPKAASRHSRSCNSPARCCAPAWLAATRAVRLVTLRRSAAWASSREILAMRSRSARSCSATNSDRNVANTASGDSASTRPCDGRCAADASPSAAASSSRRPRALRRRAIASSVAAPSSKAWLQHSSPKHRRASVATRAPRRNRARRADALILHISLDQEICSIAAAETS